MSDNLALRLANLHVHSYADASLMQRHAEAMACRNCEDILKAGIEAYRWLRNAEDTMREAAYRGLIEYDRERQDAVSSLYLAWLGPCEFAEKWIAQLQEKGYTPDNLNEFRKACEEVEDAVERIGWRDSAANARVMASADEEWE